MIKSSAITIPETFFSVKEPNFVTNNNQRGLKINILKSFNLNPVLSVVKIEESVKSLKRFLIEILKNNNRFSECFLNCIFHNSAKYRLRRGWKKLKVKP